MRTTNGSSGDEARADDKRRLVFDCLTADSYGEWTFEFYRISLSVRRGRICKLARCEQSCIRVVSEARARPGYGALRQRLFHRGRGRTLPDLAPVLSLGMACGICRSGTARFPVAFRVAPDVLPPSGASADQLRRTPDDPRRYWRTG